jgi:hypothetical protein
MKKIIDIRLYVSVPPVSLIPVVHLDLRISPRIFEKFRNDPNVIFRGLGEDDSSKKPEAKKSRDTIPLNVHCTIHIRIARK